MLRGLQGLQGLQEAGRGGRAGRMGGGRWWWAVRGARSGEVGARCSEVGARCSEVGARCSEVEARGSPSCSIWVNGSQPQRIWKKPRRFITWRRGASGEW